MKRLVSTILVAAAALLSACSQIDTGNVGVEASLGQVKEHTLPPGVYFTLFKRVTEVSAKELPLQLTDLKPQTQDKITLADLDLDIYMQIDPGKAPAIMTRWPGDVVEVDGEGGARVGMNYVMRQAREVVYNVVAQFGSATVHTERTAIAARVVAQLQKDLDESAGKGWFFVRSANVRNLVTDPALEANIKAAAAAQFELQKERNKVEVAKAEADRKRIEAMGEADAIRIKAEAVAKQGGSEYVQLKWIEKWDGKQPTTSLGAGAAPIVSIK